MTFGFVLSSQSNPCFANQNAFQQEHACLWLWFATCKQLVCALRTIVQNPNSLHGHTTNKMHFTMWSSLFLLFHCCCFVGLVWFLLFWAQQFDNENASKQLARIRCDALLSSLSSGCSFLVLTLLWTSSKLTEQVQSVWSSSSSFFAHVCPVLSASQF